MSYYQPRPPRRIKSVTCRKSLSLTTFSKDTGRTTTLRWSKLTSEHPNHTIWRRLTTCNNYRRRRFDADWYTPKNVQVLFRPCFQLVNMLNALPAVVRTPFGLIARQITESRMVYNLLRKCIASEIPFRLRGYRKPLRAENKQRTSSSWSALYEHQRTITSKVLWWTVGLLIITQRILHTDVHVRKRCSHRRRFERTRLRPHNLNKVYAILPHLLKQQSEKVAVLTSKE